MDEFERIVIITKKKHFDFLSARLPLAELIEELPSGQGSHLICFGTGLIVPENILKEWRFKLNFHGAPAFYPGRDPHHWAAYHKSDCYGATLHAMSSTVDSGPIYAQISFGVIPCLTPTDYLNLGEMAMRSLLDCWVFNRTVFQANKIVQWTGAKKSRSDLIEMCDFRGLDDDEIVIRRMAFSGFESYFIED